MPNNPIFPNFKKLNLDDKFIIDAALKDYQRNVYELCFATLYIWKDYFFPTYSFINDNLCILLSPINEEKYFLEPIGRKKVMSTIKECLNYTGRVATASSEYTFTFNHECFDIKALRNHYDYIYLTKDLIELKGRKYDGKRNHLKRFQKKYSDYKFLPIGKNNKKDALELFELWFINKTENSKPSVATSKMAYDMEFKALTNAFNDFDKLSLRGGGIFIGGKLKGFFIGNDLNKKMAVGQFMYADPDIKSIFQMLQWEGVKNIFYKHKYINLEDDLGLPGLRRMKLSYYPAWLEGKFEIKFQK